MWKIILIVLAVLYVLSPFDFLPDYIFGWGWLDDAAVLFVLWQIFLRLKQRTGAFQGSRNSASDHGRQSGTDSGRQESTPQSPHEVLGVSEHATLDEIKQAYRHLAAQYHPDKVSHLGEEFRELAEKRFKEIQEAYQKLTQGK